MNIKRKEGMALIIVLCFVLLLVFVATYFMLTSLTEIRMTRRQTDSTKALYLAETAIERALDLLDTSFNDSPTGEGTIFDLSSGKYSYDVSTTGTAGILRVRGTGYVPDNTSSDRAERTVEVLVNEASIFSIGGFAAEKISMDMSSSIDSYDSRNGDYGGGNVGSEGHIGTSSISTDPPAIILLGNASVTGDAWIGPGGDTSQAIKDEADPGIQGTLGTLEEEKELPQVIPPSGLEDKGSISLGGEETDTISESGQYSDILCEGNSILTVANNATIYVTGTLAFDGYSQLHIADGAEVTTYVNGELRVDADAKINNLSKDPTMLDILGTDNLTNVTFDTNSVYYGTLYTRNADLVFDSNVNFYGSVIGKTVHWDSTAAIHYDEALEDKVGGPTAGLKARFWREI
jgi:hypothetical protein